MALLARIIFCRVFVNHQTAAAHQRIFREIEDIVRFDMGQRLQWHYLHADIRKLGRFLSGNMNTQNALRIVVCIMNRLAYFRSTHNARYS